MRSTEELIEYVKWMAWSYRHISTVGVVPVSLAWELIEEIKERERKRAQGRLKEEKVNNETEKFKQACFAAQKEIERIEKQRDALIKSGRNLMQFLENETVVGINSEYV